VAQMAKNWTEAQRAAIFTKDADLLVSAAAGSGKTAVLVERIIQKITDSVKPVDIDRLLVVTFTNAAAAEMRQRIADALAQRLDEEPENEGLRRQLTLLPTASITTIHGFCHSLLRENFTLLGLDPSFKIADTTENELLRLSALEEVIEELYEDPVYADAFLQLTEAYLQLKNPDPFYALVNGIYDFVMSLPRPAEWLKTSAERFSVSEGQEFSDTVYAATLLASGKELVSGMLEKYDMMLSLLEHDDGQEALWQHMQEERAMLAELLSAESYQAFYLALRQTAFTRIPASPKEAMPIYRAGVTDMRERIKAQEYKRLREELFALPDSEQKAIEINL